VRARADRGHWFPGGIFLLTVRSPRMQNRHDLPRVVGSLVEWLVIAVVAGAGALATADPALIEVLVTAEL
jgi:hypothetical protein